MNSVFIILMFACKISVDSSKIGRKSSGHFERILGGHEANIEERPYFANIYRYSGTYCGATIINKDTILTAAHCADGRQLREMVISVGTNKSKRGEGTLYKVSAAFIHPGYAFFPVGDVQMARNDVAVLKLTTNITFNNKTNYIKLQPKNVPVPEGTMAITIGHGIYQKNGSLPLYLQELETKIVSNGECNRRYNKINFEITDDLLCTFTPNKGACYGDSGGPLVVGNHVIGVASSVITCGDPFYPTTYANVSHLYDFIAKHCKN